MAIMSAAAVQRRSHLASLSTFDTSCQTDPRAVAVVVVGVVPVADVVAPAAAVVLGGKN